MAVHFLTGCINSIETMFGESFDRHSDRLELGFDEADGVDEGMDGWMDNCDEGMVCMFCDKVIENKKLSDNLGENLWIKKNGA